MGRCGLSSCDNSGTLRCGRCKLFYYCSQNCQKEDWKNHKQKCKVNNLAGFFVERGDKKRVATKRVVFEDFFVLPVNIIGKILRMTSTRKVSRLSMVCASKKLCKIALTYAFCPWENQGKGLCFAFSNNHYDYFERWRKVAGNR